MRPSGRMPLRLVVTSPDGSRVLARPNGLAGWALPTIAADAPPGAWDDDLARRAGSAIGAAVEPVAPFDGAWHVRPTGRVPAAGTTWIGRDELDRLGADAGVARAVLDAVDVSDV